MSTHAAIAYRISPDLIQYGNILSDGGLYYVGWVLEYYYSKPELVKYLFSLGQLDILGAPHTEKNPSLFDSKTHTFCTRVIDGEYTPHKKCKKENEIHPDYIADYFYIYENDEWFYIKPGAVMQKIPLLYALVRSTYLKEFPKKRPNIRNKHDPDICVNYEMDMAFLKTLLHDYPKTDSTFKEMLDSSGLDIKQTISKFSKEDFPLNRFYDSHKDLINYFDRWCVYGWEEKEKPISKVHLRKATKEHVETCLWNLNEG